MDLHIELAQNGFVVYEGTPNNAMIGKKWAFETSESLAEFVKEWGYENYSTDK